MATEQPHNNRARLVRFGVFEADLRSGELRRSGIRVRLQEQPFKLLTALLEAPGEVVSRESLEQYLWGSDTTVDFDHSLGIAVNKLREALGDHAENPRFVETLAKRGYRFIAPVKTVEDMVDAQSAKSSLPAAAPASLAARSVPWRWDVLGLACVCLALGIALFLRLRAPFHLPYRVEQVTHSGHVLTNNLDDMDIESFSSTVSDGMRLYFSQMDNGNPVLAVALAANGEISHIQLPPEIGAPLIGSLAPDGSKLVIHSHLQTDPEQPLWIVPTLGGDARRVPNVLAHDATWMPDGHRLLVANSNELTIVEADGSEPHKLVSTPGLAFWLRWSPDGRRLRFTLRDPKRQTTELWEVAADGGNPHPVLPGWSQPASECCGSWTSDGEDYVFQSWHNGHNDIWSLRERPWYLRSRKPRQITSGPLAYEAPSTLPGGHRINFIGVNTEFELLRALPKSSAFAGLEQSLSAAEMAEYSSDGQWVAWLNASDGSLWRSRIDGSERIELTTPPLRIFTMKWSPDNKHLALMAEKPGMPWKLYLIAAEGGKPTPLLNEDRNEADPDWSADGQLMVFGRPPNRMDSVQPKAIYLLNLHTRQVSEIPGSIGLFSPRLSPDGRYIAAIRLDQKALLLFDRSKQQWTTLTTHGVGDPTWSHDGRSLFFKDFLEEGKPIYRISVPAGEAKQVATISSLLPVTATDYRLIGLAPGDLPVVSAHTSTVNLYSVDLDEH
jgi:Tol biopolymer transport system component/DNA-binding winged helix-turn-helix (wHTH) protein